MAIEVVKEIQEAEARAESLKKQAMDRAKQIIKCAYEEADKKYSDAQAEAERIYSATVKKKEDEANEKALQILSASMDSRKAIYNVDGERMDKALKLIVERIVKPDVNS